MDIKARHIRLFPTETAELCVACGLCLPHCPTYRRTRNENASPRGRIALLRALAAGELPLTPGLERHLSLCLGCRACENVCPANVEYGRLLNVARAHIEQTRPRRWRWLLLRELTSNSQRLGRVLRLYQKSGLQWLLRTSGVLRLGGLATVEIRLPPMPRQQTLDAIYPPQRRQRGRVALFTGCATSIADQTTLHAAIRVLTHLGYEVEVPAGQGCCGALHLHEGHPEAAFDLMRANLKAFDFGQVDAIIYVASGCGVMLREYGKQLPGNRSAFVFAGKSKDINQFLTKVDWPPEVRLGPLPRRVAVHDPCSLTHVLRQQQAPYRLLKKIPRLEVIPLPDNRFCCGGAGIYPLNEPDMANRLRADKLEHLEALKPDYLVTSNIGCALHLAAGMQQAGLPLKVIHPVVLLEQQLQTTNIVSSNIGD